MNSFEHIMKNGPNAPFSRIFSNTWYFKGVKRRHYGVKGFILVSLTPGCVFSSCLMSSNFSSSFCFIYGTQACNTKHYYFIIYKSLFQPNTVYLPSSRKFCQGVQVPRFDFFSHRFREENLYPLNSAGHHQPINEIRCYGFTPKTGWLLWDFQGISPLEIQHYQYP